MTEHAKADLKKPLLAFALFLLVAAAGFNIIPLLIALAMKLQLFPGLFNTPDGIRYLHVWMLGSGVWIWLASVLAAIGFFFSPPPRNRWLLLAPLYIPLAYGLGVFILFGLR